MTETRQPRRIQRRRQRGWRMPDGAKYVGRPTRWGNPWRIYHGHTLIGPSWGLARRSWGHLPPSECVNAYITSSPGPGRAEMVAAFRDLLKVRLRDEPDRLRKWLAPLTGKDLACWCPLVDAAGGPVPCHADVLLEYVALTAGPSGAAGDTGTGDPTC